MNRIIIGSVFLIFLLSACRITNTIHPHFKGCWKIYIVNSDNAEREYGVLKFISESEAQVFQLHKEYHIRSRNIRIDGDSLFFLFENQPFRGAISPDKLMIRGATDKLILSLSYDAEATMLDRQVKNQFVPYYYTPAEDLQDGLECAQAGQIHFDIDRIEDLTNSIIAGKYNDIHSLLILKNDQLVYEKYFPENIFAGFPASFYRDNYHRTQSVTKAVVSALVGIAIDKEYISSINDPVFMYFPAYTPYMTKDKEELQIKHLLNHTSGILWDEKGDDMGLMGRSKDRIRFFLEKPLTNKPGEQFSYCSGGINVLGEIIEKRTGMRLDQFANEVLFGPLGITNFHWKIDPDLKLQMGSGLSLRSRDMAKIGLLFLNEGRWEDIQVISEHWISQSTGWLVSADDQYGMGYCWWQRNFLTSRRNIQSYFAWGTGDQHIFIFPELDLIVVSTAGNYSKGQGAQLFRILDDHLLKAFL